MRAKIYSINTNELINKDRVAKSAPLNKQKETTIFQ